MSKSPAVTDYRAVWNAEKNRGNIMIKVQGTNKGQDVKVGNAAEFLAILTLLQGPKTVFAKPPFFDTKP